MEPVLPLRDQQRRCVDVFGGLDRRLRIPEGDFAYMENLCSDRYPVLSTRPRRGILPGTEAVQGILSKDALCYVEGRDFVMNGYRTDLALSPGPKELVSMGAYVIILPDRKWINTLNLAQFGSLDAQITTAAPVRLALCDGEGQEYGPYAPADTEPEAPENRQLWLDTENRVLKRYSAANSLWVEIPATYVKISCPGIGGPFRQYDGVYLSGLEEDSLNGSQVLWYRSEDFLVVAGLLEGSLSQEGPVTVSRRMPEVDFLTESGNRLWGCRYGLNAQGQVVNEIYASKLGDFTNWNCFMGTAADSYAASCGTDGPFTGAVTHLGYPLFFKENWVHKVYGSYPASYQIQATALRGVRKGSHRSLAQVGETLYYQSLSGICAYDGSLPVEVSAPLGGGSGTDAVAGSLGSKYYLSLLDGDGKPHLLVYDTARNLWHREDGLRIRQFCAWGDELYGLGDRGIVALRGTQGEPEAAFSWQAVTGELGRADPDSWYPGRVTLRLALEAGGNFSVWARYDGWGGWESLGQVHGDPGSHLSLSLRPRRCRFLQLKLEGRGPCRIYSMTRTLEKGSEHP